MMLLIIYLVGVVFAWVSIGVLVYIHKREDDPFPAIYSLFSWLMVISVILVELVNRFSDIKLIAYLGNPHLLVEKIYNKFKK